MDVSGSHIEDSQTEGYFVLALLAIAAFLYWNWNKNRQAQQEAVNSKPTSAGTPAVVSAISTSTNANVNSDPNVAASQPASSPLAALPSLAPIIAPSPARGSFPGIALVKTATPTSKIPSNTVSNIKATMPTPPITIATTKSSFGVYVGPSRISIPSGMTITKLAGKPAPSAGSNISPSSPSAIPPRIPVPDEGQLNPIDVGPLSTGPRFSTHFILSGKEPIPVKLASSRPGVSLQPNTKIN